MSLSALNAPPLVAAALGVGCFSLFPVVRQTFEKESLSWAVVKGANLCAYGLSVWSVSQPGRYDGEIDDKNASDEMKQMGTGKQGRTLVPPAGWAFVIWAPIFLGEFVMVASQWTLSESSPMVPIIREITGPYIAAQIFQTLWTASFRPKYKQGFYKYVSAMSLSGVAYSLSFCHSAYTKKQAQSTTLGEYLLHFLPLSLHFGWTTAAALVNWNGMFALGDQVSPKAVAWIGHLTVVGATILGVLVTLKRSAPVYGGVIAWALSAVAAGLSQRIKETEKEDATRVGVYGARSQRTLCLIGATTSAAAAAVAAIV
jgi:hypothetical protein